MAFLNTKNKKISIKFTLPKLGKKSIVKPPEGLKLDPRIEYSKMLDELVSKYYIFGR